MKKIYRSNRDPHRLKGVSDILGIWKSRFLAIEVKNKIGRLSPEQRSFILRVNDEDGLAFVARSVEDVQKALGL